MFTVRAATVQRGLMHISRTRHNRLCYRMAASAAVVMYPGRRSSRSWCSSSPPPTPPPSLPTNRLSPRYDTEAVYRTTGVESSSVQLDFTNV